MKSVILITLLTFSISSFAIEKSTFYKVLSGKSETEIGNTIQQLNKEKSSSLNNAYKGALIAKQAEFAKSAVEKVKLFKSGVKLLEAEIAKQPNNLELRFLRLAIQENCPKILKYNSNITSDSNAIIEGYSKLENKLKAIILDYSKGSKALTSNKIQ